MWKWLAPALSLLTAWQLQAGAAPFGWLDDSASKPTRDWVAQQNRATLAKLQPDPRFAVLEAEAAAVLTDPDRLEPVQFVGDAVFQHHQSRDAPLGVWRRSPRAAWLNGTPAWETLLDLDRLSATDGRRWLLADASCRASRCLLRLADNGKDAAATREYDLGTRLFVPDGFALPESKSRTWWIDENRLLVAPVLGPDSLNRAQLPRTIRLWTRGTSIRQAPVLFAIDPEDAMLSAILIGIGGREGFVAVRHTDFERKLYEWVGFDGERRALPLPPYAANMGVAGDALLLRLNEDWRPPAGDAVLRQGALIAIPLPAMLDRGDASGTRQIYAPAEGDAIRSATVVGSGLVLELIHAFRSRLVMLEPNGATRILPVPEERFITVLGTEGESLILKLEAPLEPPMIMLAALSTGVARPLYSAGPAFDTDGLQTVLRSAISRDGTPISYSITYRTDLAMDGRTPTLVYGYGGYDVPLTPRYEPIFGKLWLQRGGAYVHAYLRGGGERGPGWHRGAMRRNRQQPYDDMAAVLSDLHRSGIASPATTAIMGRSNGGLMASVVMQQNPDRVRGVVIGGPLIDMLRFHELQPGATWTAEYGDPRDPDMRPFLRSYSPMQNIAPASRVAYPIPLVITSTDDDRVLPGHARRFVAALQAAGHNAFYWEDGQGGHYWELAGGPAPGDWRARARARAIEFTYLWASLTAASHQERPDFRELSQQQLPASKR